MLESRITLISPAKPWSHLACEKNGQILIWPHDNPEDAKLAGAMKSTNRQIISSQGETACWQDAKKNWKHRILPNGVSMDPMTYAISLQNADILQQIYSSWLNLDAGTVTLTVEMGEYRRRMKQKIEYRSGRFHLSGNFGGAQFSENRIIIEGKFPATVTESRIYKKLKDVVSNENIPDEAVITGIFESDGKTVIAYDAEDIKMTDIFGPETENAFIPEGQNIIVKTKKERL